MEITFSNMKTSKNPSLIQRLCPLGFRHDACRLVKLATPLMISNILTMWMMGGVSLILMSRQDQIVFNACSLANTVSLLISFSLLLGYNYGCDTLLPQYYGGEKRMMGVILQRAVLICVYVWLICGILMLNAKYVLQWIEHDQRVVHLANIYLQYFILATPFLSLSMMLCTYILTTGNALPIVLSNVIANIISVIGHYVCLYKFHLGIRAAPISITIAYAFIVLCYILYIRFSSLYNETWQPITRACLEDWHIYLKYALPGIVIEVVEIWAFETAVMFSAYISNRSLSAQTVAQQVVSISFVSAFAIGGASNILIGQNVGANKPMEARNLKNVTYIVTTTFVTLTASAILAFHDYIPYLFNITGSALPLARQVLLLVAIVVVTDAYHAIQCGMIKACGMQKWVSVMSSALFIVIGFPVSFIATFLFYMDVFGFWIGIITTHMFTIPLLFVLLYRFDWSACCQETFNRILKESREQHLLILSNGNGGDECEQLLLEDQKQSVLNINSNGIEEVRIELIANKSNECLMKLISVKLAIFLSLLFLLVVSAVFNYR